MRGKYSTRLDYFTNPTLVFFTFFDNQAQKEIKDERLKIKVGKKPSPGY
jgi:hypothetical protein